MLKVLQKGQLRYLWLALAVLALDLVSKWGAQQVLVYGQPNKLLPFLNFTLLYNTGAAFSFLSDQGGWQRWLFTGISVFVSIVIVVLLARSAKNRHLWALSLSLILAGALGNMIDRLYQGFVVDFIDFHAWGYHWPAFNIADSAIFIGAVIIILQQFWLKRFK